MNVSSSFKLSHSLFKIAALLVLIRPTKKIVSRPHYISKGSASLLLFKFYYYFVYVRKDGRHVLGVPH